MNSETLNKTRLNIEIENVLYPIVASLKQTNKSKVEIVIEIENFKEKNWKFMHGLDRNYVENYLNQIYKKRNNGDVLFEVKKTIQKEER